jgi:hypothetical protein
MFGSFYVAESIPRTVVPQFGTLEICISYISAYNPSVIGSEYNFLNNLALATDIIHKFSRPRPRLYSTRWEPFISLRASWC